MKGGVYRMLTVLRTNQGSPVIDTFPHGLQNQMPFLFREQLYQKILRGDQGFPTEKFLVNLVQPYFQCLDIAVQLR